MHSFTDTAGREWRLKLDWDLHEQVKDKTGKMLLSLGDNDCALLAELHTNFSLLVDIAWILCEEQAAAHGVVDDEKLSATRKFAKGLGGDVLHDMAVAVVGATIDFFENPAQRAAMTDLVEKARATSDVLTAALREQIAKLDPEQLAKNFTDSASSSPPSPASILGDIRLVS